MTSRHDRPVFVYGTLRIGQRLHRVIESQLIEQVAGVTTIGVLYCAGHTGFPYCDFTADGTVVGDLLTVDDDTKVWMDEVELGAGYELVDVQVTLPTGETVAAVAYHYPLSKREQHGRRVRRVVQGDWMDVVRRGHDALEPEW